MKTLMIILLFFIINLEAKEKKHILILNSYHDKMPWAEGMKNGIFSVLDFENDNYTFHIENMDTKIYNGDVYFKTLFDLYQTKYKKTQLDLILSTDNNALEFLKKYRNQVFGNIPVVFGGVNNYTDSMIDGYSNYTGVSENISYEKNIDLILKLHPNTKNIYFINDYLKTGRIVAEKMKVVEKKYKGKIDIIYNDDISFHDLKKDIKRLSKDTVVLWGAYYTDTNNEYITYEKAGEYILSSSPVPVYCIAEFSITHNIIGGHVISSFAQGTLIAKLGKQIIQGTSAKNLQVIKEDSNQYIFNENGLKRYKINKHLLPQNSHVIYDNITYYDQFENILNVNYLLLLILVVAVLAYVYKKLIFNERAILRLLVYGPIVFLPLVIGTLIYNLVQFNDKVYKSEIKKLKTEYLEKQQNISREEIEKTILYVKNMEVQTTLHLKENLKKRVDEAYIIANNIYEENKKLKPKKEIEKMIIDALSKIRFFDGRGYFFMNTNQGKGILFNGISKLNEKPNLLELKDSNGKYIIQNQIKIVKIKGAGYTSHLFNKIDGTKASKKLTYVRMFEPYDWHIGTGEYLDDFDQIVKEKIYNYVSNIRYGNNGYLFSLTPKGIVVAHGDSPKLVGKDMSAKVDANGLHYAKEIIKNAMLNNFKFTKFGWFNTETQKLDTKYAYAAFINKYNIIIGTGVYDNDVKKIIIRKTLKLNNKNKEQLAEIIKISLIVLVLVLIISFILSSVIKRIFQEYNRKLNDLNTSLEHKITKEIKVSKEKDNLIYQQSKMASMGEMIGNIAHQWRQPLSIISVGATGLKLQKEHGLMSDKFFTDTCNTINDNAQYLSKTIDDFKNFIKNDRDKVKLNLEENIDSFLSLVNPSIKNHQVNIELDLDKDLIINGYPNELTQCFMNLFNNAKDALKDIDTQRYLFISTKVEKNQVVISFKDNAGGIDENVIHNIFEPYFTTKHKSQGTGLGLSMTYKIIVEGMDGTIDVKNSEYLHNDKKFNGAEFIIKLPL